MQLPKLENCHIQQLQNSTVGQKSNIDQEISYYPSQTHSNSLFLTYIYSKDLRIYLLNMRNSLLAFADPQGHSV